MNASRQRNPGRSVRQPWASIYRLLIGIVLLTSLVAPGDSVRAACAPGTPCVNVRVAPTVTVSYPRIDWKPVGELRTLATPQHTVAALSGDATVVLNDTAARMLGLSAAATSGTLYGYAHNAPMVFARYLPGTNELRIDIVRIEKSPAGIVRVSQALFGPHHGGHWAAQRKFLSSAELRAGSIGGINPFDRFADPADDIFHRIGPDGMLVAVGHAMRRVNASIGVIAVANMRFDQTEHDDGGLLTTNTTYTIDGYVRPDWWIATPPSLQPYGNVTAAICVGKEDPAKCLPHHIARSGISVTQWSGGNMPAIEDHLFHSEETHSGFTVLSFALATGLLVFGGAYLLGPELAGVDTAVTAGTSVSGVSANAAFLGAGAAAGYVGISGIMNGGSLFDEQHKYLGAALGNGERVAAPAATPQLSSLQQSTRSLQIERPLRSSLQATRELYEGKCQDGFSIKSCRDAGLSDGVVLRVDSIGDDQKFPAPARK